MVILTQELLKSEALDALRSVKDKIDKKLYCYLLSSDNLEHDLSEWLGINAKTQSATDQFIKLDSVYSCFHPITHTIELMTE